MNDEQNKSGDGLVDVTIQWYKGNVIRLVFNGRMIWEAEDIAIDDIIGALKETTLHLTLLESAVYSKILLQGLQVNRLEQINLLVQLRVEQWQMEVALFEKRLKQRLTNTGFAHLLKDIEAGSDSDCDDNNSPLGADSNCEDSDDIPFDADNYDDTLIECKDCIGGQSSCANCKNADPNDPDNTVCKGPCNKCPIDNPELCKYFDKLSCDGDCGTDCDYFGKTCGGCGGRIDPENYPDARVNNTKPDMGPNSSEPSSNANGVNGDTDGVNGVGLASDDDIIQR